MSEFPKNSPCIKCKITSGNKNCHNKNCKKWQNFFIQGYDKAVERLKKYYE